MADLVRTLTSILKNGGQRWAYRLVTVDSSDVITAAETNWHNGNYRMSSKLTSNTNEEAVPGEDGNILVYEPGVHELTYLLKSAQLDKATLDWIKTNGSKPIYFQMIFSWGKGSSSKKLEVFIPLAKISGDFDIDLPGRKFDITIQILNNASAHTPSNFTGISWVAGAVGDFATGIDEKFTVAETM